MRVSCIALRQFRNYHDQKINIDHNINVFIGDNGQGKTNILEAIYLSAIGRSHRTAIDNEIIHWDHDEATIEINFERHQVIHHLLVRIKRGEKKQFILNDHIVKTKELIGTLNVVLFSPEDLLFIKGAPVLRRRFMDIEFSQTSKIYYQELMKYNRIVQQRNHLLKKVKEKLAKIDQLDSWDDQLCLLAASLVKRRQEALKKVSMLANLMHRKLTDSQETLTTTYHQPYFQEGIDEQHHISDPDWYKKKIITSRIIDIARGTTTVGPHRDDLWMFVNGISLRTYGSQGQQRTGALAYKLAEIEYIKSETGEYPVLLLDDVMSELDSIRREQLTLFVRDRIQTFITTTDKQLFQQPKFVSFYHVSKGTITR